MSTSTIDNIVVQEGWTILVEQLGLKKATQFVVLLERGEGDAVQDLKKYWEDASIDEIFQRVSAWKAQQQ